MRVAICDDERKELAHLQTLVKKYDPGIEVSLFLSAESLLDGLYLLSVVAQTEIEVLRLIRPHAGREYGCPEDVFQHLLGGQAVALIHGKKKAGQHQRNHQEHGPCAADGAPGQKIGRDANGRRSAKTDKLPFGEIERHFGFNAR